MEFPSAERGMEKLLEKIAMRLLAKAENSKSIVKTWFYYFLLSVLDNIVYAFYQDQRALGRKIWVEVFVFLALSSVAILLHIDILILPAFAVAVFLFTPKTKNLLYLGTSIAAYFSILATIMAVRNGIVGRAAIVIEVLSLMIGYGFVMVGEWAVLNYKKLKSTFSKLVKVIGLLMFVSIFVFISVNAYAFNPNHVVFYTYGGFDAIYNAFHFIALIFSDHAYQGLFFTVMTLSLFFAGFRNYVHSLQGRTTDNILSWSLPVLISFVLYMALIVPKGQVTIYDTVLNKSADVGGIPIGITTVAGIASEVENGIITMIDTTSINRDTDYENSAGGVGVMTIMNMAMHGVRSSDVYLDRSLKRYITDCVFYDLADPKVPASNKITYQELIDGTEPFTKLLSKAAVFQSIYTVYYDSSNNAGEPMTCHDAWTNISALLNNNNNFNSSLKNICASAGVDTSNQTALTHCENVITAYLNVLYDGQDSAVTSNAMDFIRQAYVANEIYRASVDANANFLVNYKISNAGMNIGMAFNNWIPTIRAVLISLGLSLLPFLIIFLPTPFYGKILGGIAGVFVFMVSWAAIDAVVHHFLVGEAAVLFQSVLIHNVGYGAFETMSVPLQHAMAAWGYVRSLGMGLAVIATGIVTKTGAYGLQMAAGRMESAVTSQASSIGERVTNPAEQGSVEKEIMTSSAFSQKIAPSFTYQDLINGTANLEAKRMGQGLAYKNVTDASSTGFNAESMSAGMTNAEAKIAEQNGLIPRNYGRLHGTEKATNNITAWKTAGKGNMGNGAVTVGEVKGINKGSSVSGQMDAVHGNTKALAGVVEKQSAAQMAKERKQFEEYAKLNHALDNVSSAEDLGKIQGLYDAAKAKGLKHYEQEVGGNEIATTEFAEKLNMWGKNKELRVAAGAMGMSVKDFVQYKHSMGQMVLNKQTAARLTAETGHKFTAGERVTWAFDPKTHKIGWAVGDKGYASTNQDVYRTIIGSSEQATTPNASVNVLGTTNGEAVTGTINGDIGVGLEDVRFKGVSKGLIDALKGANGVAQVNNGQLMFSGVASGKTAVALGNYLIAHGNKVAGEKLVTIGKHGGVAKVDLTAGENGVPIAVVNQRDMAEHTAKSVTDTQNVVKTGTSVSAGDAFKNAVETAANTGNFAGFNNASKHVLQDALGNRKVLNALTGDFATAITSGFSKNLNIDRQAQYRINGGLNLSGSLIGEVLGVSAGAELMKGKTVSGKVLINSARVNAEQKFMKIMNDPHLNLEQKQEKIRDYIEATHKVLTALQKKGLDNVVTNPKDNLNNEISLSGFGILGGSMVTTDYNNSVSSTRNSQHLKSSVNTQPAVNPRSTNRPTIQSSIPRNVTGVAQSPQPSTDREKGSINPKETNSLGVGVSTRSLNSTPATQTPSPTEQSLEFTQDKGAPNDNINRPTIESNIPKETVANSTNDTNTVENQPHIRTDNNRLQPKEFDINTAKVASGVKTAQQIKANSESNAESQRIKSQSTNPVPTTEIKPNTNTYNTEATPEMMRQKEPATMFNTTAPNPSSNIQNPTSIIQNQSSTNPASTQSLNKSIKPTPEVKSNAQSNIESTQETKVEPQPVETMPHTPEVKPSNQNVKTEITPEVKSNATSQSPSLQQSNPKPNSQNLTPNANSNQPLIQSDIPKEQETPSIQNSQSIIQNPQSSTKAFNVHEYEKRRVAEKNSTQNPESNTSNTSPSAFAQSPQPTTQTSNSFNIHEYEKKRAMEKNSTQEMLRKLDSMRYGQNTDNGENVSESQNDDGLNPPSGFSRR